MHVDSNGIITQADGDGGDSCQRQFMFWFLWYYWNILFEKNPTFNYSNIRNIDESRNLLDPTQTGIYQRYPNPKLIGEHSFWTDPNEFSRDQERPLVMALGADGDSHQLYVLIWSHIKRFSRYQNKDWPSPANLGEYIRALWSAGCDWIFMFYPILFFCDLFLLLGSMITVGWIPQIDLSKKPIFIYPQPDDVDVNNALLTLCQAKLWLPTPISMLSRYIILKYYRQNLGCTSMGGTEDNAIMGALAWYHRGESGGNNEFVALFRPVVLWMSDMKDVIQIVALVTMYIFFILLLYFLIYSFGML